MCAVEHIKNMIRKEGGGGVRHNMTICKEGGGGSDTI